MASKKWNVAVTDLTGSTHLHDLPVEADNWMSALRAGRARVGEEGGVPQGASCAVSPDGVVTILDPVSRRRFVLTQRDYAPAPASVPAPAPAIVAAPAASQPAPPVAGPAQPDPTTGKRKKFETVAFDASSILANPPVAQVPAQAVSAVSEPAPRPRSVPPNPLAPVQAAQPVSIPAQSTPFQPTPLQAPTDPNATAAKRRKFQTVAFDASSMALQPPQPAVAPQSVVPQQVAPQSTAPQQTRASSPAAAPSNLPAQQPAAAPAGAAITTANAPTFNAPKPASVAPVAAQSTSRAQMLHQRSEDPTPKNPLTYRERSFVMTGAITRSDAETTLLAELARLKEELASAKRGKFVNLALFDHRWQDRPQRPPIATLQWKDWKGDPELSFPEPPAPQATRATPSATDDRLATAFEALQDLPFLNSAAEGLEFAVKLLSDLIASQAIAACLYDINTDELRVVAAAGPGASERKTQAIPVAIGLFGQAARGGDKALVVSNVQNHPEFDPGLDSAPGIQARNMLLRPLVQDGQLFGVLQLTNRVDGEYSNEDVNLINYVAERVADFVRQAKLRGRT